MRSPIAVDGIGLDKTACSNKMLIARPCAASSPGGLATLLRRVFIDQGSD